MSDQSITSPALFLRAPYPPLLDELRGPRVLVRPYRLEDAEAFQAAVDESREHMRPWLSFADAYQTIDEARDWMARKMAQHLRHQIFSCGIWEVASGRFLGGIALHPKDWSARTFEIGYWLRASAQGHGYLTEATRLITDFAFESLEAQRVAILCDARNTRSANVARRLGFPYEGHMRHDYQGTDGTAHSSLYFALTRQDWDHLAAGATPPPVFEGDIPMSENALPADDTSSLRLPPLDELRGERVLVRPYRLEDAAALHEAVAESRDHVRPWLPFADLHQTVEESRDWILTTMAKVLLREDGNLAMWEIATGRYLGGIGLHPRDWSIRSFEIGYWLRASAQGHGYLTEAVRLVTDFAFDVWGAQRAMIRCDARNARSAGVARRLGFLQEAYLRNEMRAPDGRLRDTLVFSRIPSDPRWPQR